MRRNNPVYPFIPGRNLKQSSVTLTGIGALGMGASAACTLAGDLVVSIGSGLADSEGVARVIAYNIYKFTGWRRTWIAQKLALYDPDIVNFSESSPESVIKAIICRNTPGLMVKHKYSIMKKITLFFLLTFLALTVSAQLKNVEHVVLIGVDGFGAYAFDKAEIPNIRSLMKRGSWSLEARSVLPSSSAVNWASMLMGAGPELHGFTTWGSKKPDMPSRVLDQYGMFPSVYGLLHERDPVAEIGVIYEWEGIGYLFPKQAVDFDRHCSSDSLSAATAENYIREKKPDFLFLYFHNVDVTGHQTGHDTPAYYQAVENVDAQIGQVLQAIRDAGMEDNTVVMLSADHGGTGKGHGGVSMVEMQIPWIIAGPGIKENYQVQGSIMTFDTAATLAKIFGLDTPQVWIGRPVNEVFKRKRP